MELPAEITLSSDDYKEILHHLKLADIKTKLFCGRKSQLTEVKAYLQKVGLSSPLMIYGSGGGGESCQPIFLGYRFILDRELSALTKTDIIFSFSKFLIFTMQTYVSVVFFS